MDQTTTTETNTLGSNEIVVLDVDETSVSEIQVGEKRKFENQSSGDEVCEPDDEESKTKRSKTSIIDDEAHIKAIFDLFSISEEDREEYEDYPKEAVFGEVVMKHSYKNYLKWIVQETPKEYKGDLVKLLYTLRTGKDLHRRSMDETGDIEYCSNPNLKEYANLVINDDKSVMDELVEQLDEY